MRDEVLIKRQLVAMATWIMANKRVRGKCLLGDGMKWGNRRKAGKRQTEIRRAKRAKAVRRLVVFLLQKNDSGDPPLSSYVKYAFLRSPDNHMLMQPWAK